jgi:hypothetical protein
MNQKTKGPHPDTARLDFLVVERAVVMPATSPPLRFWCVTSRSVIGAGNTPRKAIDKARLGAQKTTTT